MTEEKKLYETGKRNKARTYKEYNPANEWTEEIIASLFSFLYSKSMTLKEIQKFLKFKNPVSSDTIRSKLTEFAIEHDKLDYLPIIFKHIRILKGKGIKRGSNVTKVTKGGILISKKKFENFGLDPLNDDEIYKVTSIVDRPPNVFQEKREVTIVITEV